jgi:hypothetical protein
MKHKQLKHGIFAAMMLAAFAASAQEYPAADFQPKVVYQDESVVKSSASAPCDSKQAAATAVKDDKVEFDANYPASNFQPKVIFSSAN